MGGSMSRIFKKEIKALLPKEWFDCTRANGIGLAENSYSLFTLTNGKSFTLLTASPAVINKLSKKFSIKYEKHFWMHYSQYIITRKS
jgi:hypothetical protein